MTLSMKLKCKACGWRGLFAEAPYYEGSARCPKCGDYPGSAGFTPTGKPKQGYVKTRRKP